jgi:hypothetical protein
MESELREMYQMSNWFQRKIEQLQRDRRNKRFKEDDFFTIYTGEGVNRDDIIAVEILRGKFAGISYAYTSCNITDEGRCSYDIRPIKSENIHPVLLTKNKQFSRITGQVLLVILDAALRNEIERIEGNDELELGEDYTEEPVQPRTVHEKNTSLSEI